VTGNVRNSGLRYLVEALPKAKRVIAKAIAEAKSFSKIIKYLIIIYKFRRIIGLTL
jgi:hypothetical protein